MQSDLCCLSRDAKIKFCADDVVHRKIAIERCPNYSIPHQTKREPLLQHQLLLPLPVLDLRVPIE